MRWYRPPTPSYLTEASLSYGDQRWEYTDYNGVDDTTEVWWDPEATGQDEIGKEGVGMWRYANHGQRYLPGEWTDDTSALFDPTDADTILDAPPPDETAPEYPAPN